MTANPVAQKVKPNPAKLFRGEAVSAMTPNSSFACFGLPFSTTGRTYYSAVAGDAHRDLSFGYADGNGPVATILCDNGATNALTCAGSPIEIWTRPDHDPSALRHIVKNLAGQMREIAKAQGMSSILLRTGNIGAWDNLLTSHLLSMRLLPQTHFDAFADLSLDDATLLSGMRSGHRQQVKWGQQNLSFSCAGEIEADSVFYGRFQALHAEVSGRITRSQQSWDSMFELIRDGQGDLILSAMDGKTMGGTLILDADGTAFYASGAYLRDHFDKPLTHAALFNAMLRARSRGNRRFHIGEVARHNGDWDEKNQAIGWFKAGFSASVRSSLVWSIPVS